MPDIRQRIGLDGADQVKQQLQDLGTTGQTAFKQLQDAISANDLLGKVGPALDAVSSKAKELGSAFSDVGSAFNDVNDKARAVATNFSLVVAGIGALATGIFAAINSTAQLGEEQEKLAARVGLSRDQFNALTFAFQQYGVTQDEAARGLAAFDRAIDAHTKEQIQEQQAQDKLNLEYANGQIKTDAYFKSLNDLQQKAKDSLDPFTRLGVQLQKNADGTVNQTATLLKASDALAALPNSANKAAITMALVGSKSAAMAIAINQGSDALQRQIDLQKIIAPTLSETGQAIEQNFNKAVANATAALQSLREAAAVPFEGLLTPLINAFTQALVENRASVLALANDIATKLRPVVSDLVLLLSGKGDQIASDSVVAQARDIIVKAATDIKAAVTEIIIPTLLALVKTLDVVAQAMNGIFGTNLTGGEIAAALVITRLIGLFGLLRAAISLVVTVVTALVTALGAIELALAAVAFAVGFFGTTLIIQAARWVESVGGFWSAFEILGTAAFNAIFNLLADFGDILIAAFAPLVSAAGSLWNGIVAAAQNAWQKITDGANSAVETVKSAWQAVSDFFVGIWNSVVSAGANAWQSLQDGANAVGQAIVDDFNGAIDAVVGFFTDLESQVLDIFNSIVQAAQSVISTVAAALQGGNSGGAPSGGGFARGGQVYGAGTSTSDSIPAWLSHGEFVQQALAVRKYGTSFMHALNRGIVPVDAVRGIMRGFANGGFVERLSNLIPSPARFAEGGLVSIPANGSTAGRPIILNIGGDSFALTAGDDVAVRLSKYAAVRATRSAGPAPGWKRG